MFGLKTLKASFANQEHLRNIKLFTKWCEELHGISFPINENDDKSMAKFGLLFMWYSQLLTTELNQFTKVYYSTPEMMNAFVWFLTDELKIDVTKAVDLAQASI